MRRRRYQKGSLQSRRHGKKRVWIVQYYDSEGHHRYHTIGRMAEIADQTIVINDTHYGRVEDAQMGILHMLCYAFIENPEWADATTL